MSKAIPGLSLADEPETPLQHQAIDIPNNSQPPPSTSYNQQPNLPCGDLLRNRKEYLEICVPLYEASITGDWKSAKVIIDKCPELVRFGITENHDTALHVAALTKSTKFVENLVNLMGKEDLQLENKKYDTALCLAAAAGSIELAEIMVKKNRALLNIPGSDGMMPLYMAALFGHGKMAKYLYTNSKKMSGDNWTPLNRGQVLLKCVEENLFDVALDILNDCPDILDYREDLLNGQKGLPISSDILRVLAQKPDAFGEIRPIGLWRIINSFMQLLRVTWENAVKKRESKIDIIIKGPLDHLYKDETEESGKRECETHQLLRIIWDDIAHKNESEIDDIIKGKNDKETYSSQVIFVAAEMGNTKFLVELIRRCPDLIWKKNDDGLSIFHIAVSHRHESIYNLLYEMGSIKNFLTPLKDENGNNMLHLAGKIAEDERLQQITGVAMQMQRELLWFKEIEATTPSSYRKMKNKDGLTPHELFTKEHKDLLTRSEKWMKATAGQSMVVAALVATIAATVAFAVPGGYNQNTGIPLFFQDPTFMVFVMSDAIALSFASASMLLSFSVLISRYAEADFKESLPQKFRMLLATLICSIMSLAIAFSVSSFVLYENGLVPIFITAVVTMTVEYLTLFPFRLLVDVYLMAYGSRAIFRPTRGLLYKRIQD